VVGPAQDFIGWDEPVDPGADGLDPSGEVAASPDGNVAGNTSWRRPSRIEISPGLIPAASTRTTTCPGPGAGTPVSARYNTSSSP